MPAQISRQPHLLEAEKLPSSTNRHPPPALPPNRSWLSNFADAADAVGIPVCMSLAVIDMQTDEATQKRDFHAKTERKSSSSGKASTAGKSSPVGSKAGTSGSQAGTDSSKANTGGR